MQETKPGSPVKTSKKIAGAAIVFLLLGLWFFYMSWALRISARTILMREIPEWTTYLLFGALVGVIFAGRTFYSRPAEKMAKRVIDSFLGGFCISFFFSLHAYDVGTYLLPGKVVNYESTYEITFPGPATGKTGRCEAGIWIEDPNTRRKIHLCTTKSDLDEQKKRGMDAVWVTARMNKMGSYIIGYAFSHSQHINES
ncbi:hypothetical protein [Pseudomonas sp. IzPS59]|uniref:hypothetical protein n=1 Tax=Pseudomonas sp. IzPS59 TaxID=2774459 RepID=UPI001788798E|nr:hypothetical protein [Pseudomonas sp. IzPS59]